MFADNILSFILWIHHRASCQVLCFEDNFVIIFVHNELITGANLDVFL
jgi:hypothetical protein